MEIKTRDLLGPFSYSLAACNHYSTPPSLLGPLGSEAIYQLALTFTAHRPTGSWPWYLSWDWTWTSASSRISLFPWGSHITSHTPSGAWCYFSWNWRSHILATIYHSRSTSLAIIFGYVGISSYQICLSCQASWYGSILFCTQRTNHLYLVRLKPITMFLNSVPSGSHTLGLHIGAANGALVFLNKIEQR